MKEKSVEFQGYLYHLRSEDRRDKRHAFGLYLDIYKLSTERTGKFTLRSSCTVTIPHKEPVIDFHIHVVEKSNYLKNPFIILEVENSPLLLRIFIVDAALSKINFLKEYTISNTAIKPDCDFHVLPGPTLMWLTTDASVYLKSCIGNREDDIILINRALKILFVKCFYTCNSDHFTYLIIIKQNNAITFHFLCFNTRLENFCNPTEISNLLFLPEQFFNLVSSVFVGVKRITEEKIICTANTCCQLEQLFFHNYTCITTNEKEFIVFTCGEMRYKCAVPFSNIMLITQLMLLKPFHVSFLLNSRSGISLIQKTSNDRLIQVTKVWKDVSHAYFSDFLHSGRPMLLLLHDPSFPRNLTNFTTDEITDTQSDMKKRSFDGLKEGSEVITTMVKALEQRVSVGQISLNHAEESFQDKQRVLDCAIRSVMEFTKLGKFSRNHQETYLVDVALGFQVMPPADQGSSSPSVDSTTVPPLYLNSLLQWQTTYRDDWILGWTFQNKSTRSVRAISGMLFACDRLVEVRQKVFLHADGQHITEPVLGQAPYPGGSVGPGQLASLLMSLRIPVCSKNCQDMFTVHSWTYSGDDRDVVQQMSSKVFFKVSDVMGKWKVKFEELSVVQQLMCFRILQTETALEVRSQCSQLQDLKGDFLKRGLSSPALLQPSTDQHPSIFVFNQSESPLSGVNFSWCMQGGNQADISVFCRTQNQLLVFIHWLYESFPPDTSVLPNSRLDHSLFCTRMWDTMASELEKAISLLRRQAKPVTLSLRDQKNMDLSAVRWRFQEYTAFRRELASVENNTDNILRHLFQP